MRRRAEFRKGSTVFFQRVQLGPQHIIHRVSSTEIQSLARLYRFLGPGELLHGDCATSHAVFRMFWREARADSFAGPKKVAAAPETKNQ